MSRRTKADEEKLFYAGAVTACEKHFRTKVGKLIGRGGFSRVYDITEGPYEVPCVLKISLLKTKKPIEREYLKREVEAQQKFNDEYLVRLLDSHVFCSESGGEDFIGIVMERCDMTLNQYVSTYGIKCILDPTKKDGKAIAFSVIDESTLRPWARDVIRGLAHLNALGYPHRDIKGENILLARQPNGEFVAKLADFGMVKPLEEGCHTRLGTPQYMAPEVRSAYDTGKYYDARCDMWSVGVTFYKAVVGAFPYALTDNAVVSSITSINTPDIPKGRREDGKAHTPFTSYFRHFLQSLLTRDPLDRPFAKDALKHPFLMPEINEMQLIIPDKVIGVLVSRNHTILTGKIAFRNEVKKRAPRPRDSSQEEQAKALKEGEKSLLTKYPFNTVKWGMTWGDFARNIALGKTDDFLVITDSGKTFQCKDKFEFEEENIMNVVVVPRRSSVARVDRDVLVRTTKDAMSRLASMKDDGNKVMDLVKELNSRFAFCYTTQRLERYALPLLDFDVIAQRLRKRQEEISRKVPMLPIALFVPPIPHEWHTSMTSADLEQADELRKAVEINYAAAVRASKRLNPDYTEQLKDLKERARTWIGPDLCPPIERALESFNGLLDIVRAHADIINRLLDYMEILDLAEKDPMTAKDQLRKLVSSCPFLQFKEKAKVRRPPSPPPARAKTTTAEAATATAGEASDEVTVLREELKQLYELYAQQKKAKEDAARAVKEIEAASQDVIESLKKKVAVLMDVLEQNHITIDSSDSDALN